MDSEGILKAGSESQDSDEPAPPGISKADFNKSLIQIPRPSSANPAATPTVGFKLAPSLKGVENAKKRLRAFSIQKKTPVTPVAVSKGLSGGSTTVLIGKLSGVKTTPKPEDVEQKKLSKPPKPGAARRIMQDSYTELQKRTLGEIEDMKRKMELVELGIPLGLICPSATNDKAMPTKAMPPIKTFLDPTKLDEIIREAKKAKAEGREFKFDYQKILPDYDNPFQRKKDEFEKKGISEEREFRKKIEKDREKDKDRRKSDRYEKDSRRYSSHRRDDKDKRRDDRDKHKDRLKEKDEKKDREHPIVEVAKRKVESSTEKETKETDVNLSDYLVCDSWSLDNEDKSTSSPKVDEKIKQIPIPRESKPKETTTEIKKEKLTDSPISTPVQKIKKLQPVMDSFKFEIDPNDDELLDMFDENSGLEKFASKTRKKEDYDSPVDMKLFDTDSNKDSNDALMDDKFLESVINEIKQEDMSDEDSQDKGLVEYDSPSKESQSPPMDPRLSITPELDDRMRDLQSSRSDYSDGYRSTESGYKSTESGYKSNASYKSGDSKGDNYRLSMEKDLEAQLNKSTVDSLETWSFVLKICQPLLFRHDRNKCYRETRSTPKIWYTENPKLCACVKDRAVVYEELETCKMSLVDRVYGCDQIPEVEFPKTRSWYPRFAHCLTESSAITSLVPASEWEADDSQTETPLLKDKRRSTTPLRSEEIYLDREYQRFMQAVWPEASESKAGTPRSTTPVRQESRKKKADDKELEDKKKTKKIKLSSEGWSQESDIEEEVEKSKKIKVEKVRKEIRKRKHSISSVSDSDETAKKKKKAMKKKAKENKKTKLKLAKRRRLSKKYLKKLKEKQKKKKKNVSDDEDIESENRKKEKKLRRKKLQKKKKALKKKKAKAKSSSSSSASSTSSSSTSTTESESEPETRKKKKKKSGEIKKNKRKQSSSESTQSEDLFDVNILNNIKTERLTDDEKNKTLVEFSPRRQKPREIINVKELQNDFVGNNIHIKKEIIEETEMVHRPTIKADFYLEDQEREFATERPTDVPQVDHVPEVQEVPIEQDIQDVPDIPDMPEVHHVKEEVSFKDIPLPLPPQTEPPHHRDTDQTADHKLLDTTSSSSVDKEFRETNSQINQLDDILLPEPSPSLYLDKESQEIIPLLQTALPEESNLSQCSSQESSASKDIPYEKDDSHLRPSSQNSNYSFNDVISASHSYQKDDDAKFHETYEQGNYEMYEQLAMAYQSDVAKQASPLSGGDPLFVSQRIETVVRARSRGEIKCDWRAGDEPSTPVPASNQRPSRWGLKPGEVNIVLTGGDEYPVREPVYQIQSIANRSENNTSGSYDEAYEDMYGASDRLQYGDCFSTDVDPAPAEEDVQVTTRTSSLDDRINHALRTTVLGEVTKDTDVTDGDKDGPEKGILVVKAPPESRNAKRVSFADGYKPGQDSDVEEPPVRKRKKSRRIGCAWPCPATHPDHVPLWDALPPPPPPPGSPPPNLHQAMMQQAQMMMQAPQMMTQPPNMLQQPGGNMLQQPGTNMLQQPGANMLQQPGANMLQQSSANMLSQQPPNMLQHQGPNMLQQRPMLQQQGQNILQQQGPNMLQQQGPNMLQQAPNMLQQAPNMLQPANMMQQPPNMMQQPPQMLQQPPQMLQQQQGVKFSLPQKLDPSVSLPNFLPPEPPPGLLSFP